jgi:hypothetical protein
MSSDRKRKVFLHTDHVIFVQYGSWKNLDLCHIPDSMSLPKLWQHSCVFQTKAYENGGIARDGAKMVNAVSCVDAARRRFRGEHVGKSFRDFA